MLPVTRFSAVSNVAVLILFFRVMLTLYVEVRLAKVLVVLTDLETEWIL